MTLDDSLLILDNNYRINFFDENDTNEVKGLYHDDCLDKENKTKKNIFGILNWGMAVSCSRNMNFVKCRERNERGKCFQCLIIFCIFAHFCI